MGKRRTQQIDEDGPVDGSIEDVNAATMELTLRRQMRLTDNKLHFLVLGDRTDIGADAAHFWRALGKADSWIGFHCATPSDQKADAEKCWFTAGRCVHEFDKEGTDAQDRWAPLFNECNTTGNFEPLWELLEEEWHVRFGARSANGTESAEDA